MNGGRPADGPAGEVAGDAEEELPGAVADAAHGGEGGEGGAAPAERPVRARLFVAVLPPPEALDAVEVAAGPLRPGPAAARWTGRERWHLTLQFLGWAEPEPVEAALAALRGEPFPVRLGAAGAFPRPRRATVLWVGVVEGAPELGGLAEAVAGVLAPTGFVPEARPYHPHLTLARFREPTDAGPLVAALGDRPLGPAWTVREVLLVESRLRREGARYSVRASVTLGTS